MNEKHRDFYLKVGMAIRVRRQNLSLSQGDLAEMVGVLRTSICNIENGYGGLSLPTLVKIANVLDVTLDTLVQPKFQSETLTVEGQEITVSPITAHRIRKALGNA